MLLAHEAVNVLRDMHCFYCAGLRSINADALCYFAASVIWRASVRPWSIDGVKIDPLQLGKYSESFRLYLLGSAGFPSNTVVTVIVSSLADVHLMATLPETKKYDGYTSHFFSLPGLDFTIDVGARMPPQWEEMCLYRGAQRPIFYTAVADLANANAYARLRSWRESRVKG